MAMRLSELLEHEAAAVAEELAVELSRSEAPHYRRLEPGALRQRCRLLVEAFVASSDGDPAPFSVYMRELTAARISEGYELAEIQRALVLLEQRAWQLAIEDANIGTLVRHLSVITSTIGQAKDEMARIFLARQKRAEAALGRLRLDGLFDGTDAHIEPGEAPISQVSRR
jgi:hypothetical protein